MMDRNLALEAVRVTEAAALASARKMGLGDATGADHAAVEAMRHAFDSMEICAIDSSKISRSGNALTASGPGSP